MKEYKLERIHKDRPNLIIDKLKFNHINDALGRARKWMKADDNLQSVKIRSLTFTITIERP